MHLSPELLKSRVKLVDVAVVAYDLGLWPDAYNQELDSAFKVALKHSPLHFVQAWHQISSKQLPPGLEEHVHTRLSSNRRRQHSASWIARFIVKVVENQTYLYESGLRAYTDVCRRLEAVIVTVLPSEIEAVNPMHSFAANLASVNHFRCEEDFVVAAATVLVATILARSAPSTRGKLVGSLTTVPVDWNPVRLTDVQVCESSMSGPYAQYMLLLNNNSIVILDTDSGAQSVTALHVHGDELVWLSAFGGHLYAGSSASLYEFTPQTTDRLVLSPLPATNRMDKNASTITFPVPGSTRLVTLCLTSRQVSADASEADMARTELHSAVGGFKNHVYRNGQVLVSLPSDQRIVAVHALDEVVDVFTESNDWWRIHVLSKQAVVAGLDIDAQVRDAVYIAAHEPSVQGTLERLCIN